MFAGRLPFTGSFAELITHHLITVPDPPSRYHPLPRALEQLILRCVDKDPAQRPQSAEELGRALEAALPAPGDNAATAAVFPVVGPAPSPAPTDAPLDTLAPPPGRTAADLTIQPARNRRPFLLVGGAAVAVAIVVVLALAGRHGGGDRGPLVVVADAQAPASALPAKPLPGRAHVTVKGVDAARVLVDGKLVAAGVHEARVLDLAPGQSHALRIEAADRAPHERAFTVAAGAEAELEVSLAPPAAETHPAAGHPKRHEGGGAGKAGQTASPTTPPPVTSKPRHRDGLVGEDIFDSK
jgi:hypothetical protein